MAVFEYKALDRAGRELKGIVEADGPGAARQKLRAEGLYPSELAEARARDRIEGRDRGRFRILSRRVSRMELVAVTRQLATLISAGLPLVTSLSGVIEQMNPSYLRLVLAQVKDRVNSGSSLADALEEHGRVFPPTYPALVRAGEASGTLEAVMEQLADFEEARLALARQVQSTLAYPILMLLTGVGVVFFLMAYVIPKLTQIFLDYGQALPLPTVILIGVSDFLRGYWPLMILTLAGAFVLWRMALKTPAGRRRWDAFLLKAPLFGPIVRQSATARFAGTLGTLIRNEVPLLTALDIVRNVVNNTCMAEALDEARREITEGESIVVPLRRRRVFPPTVLQMIAAGEQSGTLDSMLLKSAEVARGEVRTRLAILTSLLEPMMILGLGGVVGFVVLATLLPIFSMSHLVR
ncbi:MAG: type II secretion system protein GspF [Deltaproteobacteria bacterium]|nr:type II secretion system protein GspF [Deltaproteobacteria bacterium]